METVQDRKEGRTCEGCTTLNSTRKPTRETRVFLHNLLLKDGARLAIKPPTIEGTASMKKCSSCIQLIETIPKNIKKKLEEIEATLNRYDKLTKEGKANRYNLQHELITRKNHEILQQWQASVEIFKTEKASSEILEQSLDQSLDQVLTEDEKQIIMEVLEGKGNKQEAINILDSVATQYPTLKEECDVLTAKIKWKDIKKEKIKQTLKNPISSFFNTNQTLPVERIYTGKGVKILIESLKLCSNNDELKTLLQDSLVQKLILELENRNENTFQLERYLVSLFMRNQTPNNGWTNKFNIVSCIQSTPFLKARREKILSWVGKYTEEAMQRTTIDYDPNTHDIEEHKDPLLLKGFYYQNPELEYIQNQYIKKVFPKNTNIPPIIRGVQKYGITQNRPK